MLPAERYAIEHEISRVMIAYARAFDERRYAEVADFCTIDATWQRPGNPLMKGAEIRSFCLGTPSHLRFKHFIGNRLVDVVDQDNASSATSFLMFAGDETAICRRCSPVPRRSVTITTRSDAAVASGAWRDEIRVHRRLIGHGVLPRPITAS